MMRSRCSASFFPTTASIVARGTSISSIEVKNESSIDVKNTLAAVEYWKKDYIYY
jgi:hypothetical protein